LLFIHVMGAIKSGTLNLEHSYKYRTLDNYMIDRDRWQRDKQTSSHELGSRVLPNRSRSLTSSIGPSTPNTSRPI